MQKSKLSSVNDVLGQVVSVTNLSWQIKLFMLSLIIPVEASFYLGSLRLTVYRVILLLFFFPCFFKVFRGKCGRTLAADWFFLCYSLWVTLALIITEGVSVGLQSGGIAAVESFGAYLFARSFIRDELEFGRFVRLLILMVIGLSVFTIPETLTGRNFFRPSVAHIGARFGFVRSFGPFEHPILYGVFCASALSLAIYVPFQNLLEKGSSFFRTVWIILASFMSISSGALVAIFVQLILAGWLRITRRMVSRWYLFSILLIVIYFGIDLISNRPPIRVILHRLTFSAETAYTRLIIWDWGFNHNVIVHPWFGIGFAEWTRPSWMHHISMDNFWLVNMTRYGLPSFGFLATGILLLMWALPKKNISYNTKMLMRTGWCFSILGLIVAGWTVHFWNGLYAWFFFLLGSGAWMTFNEKILLHGSPGYSADV